ncbi:ArsR family transcriptional regulator [Kushneria indalinina DSM 14324]|uniref:ArsR family transcriptional regulator n=2 Tax=Kushneria indalinina TaxID=184067 RepID=A0A3D9DVM8_9GAMM|nr:ArsR family transcriptional regulator [Kushneria indalinina DSM 14324]
MPCRSDASRLTDPLYVHKFGHMDNTTAIDIFSALAQSTRLDAFRLLVQHEPEGLAAGELARHLDVPHNTLSAHLSVLSRAGLVVSQRQSRSIIYRASLEQMQDTLAFLVRDCCAGHPELCAPLLEALQPCCLNEEKTP